MDEERYLPIGEHGLIGNLRTVALVGTDGTIDWCCVPRFDAPSIFASILDRDKGGCFILRAEVPSTTKQFYFPDTNVLITRFLSDDGVAEIQDFMPIPADDKESQHFQVIRRVICVRGELPFRAHVAPRFDYGLQPHTVRLDRHGRAVFESASLSIGLNSTAPIELVDGDVLSSFRLKQGESVVFCLDRADDGMAPFGTAEEAEEAFTQTVEYWRRWLSQSSYRGRWREAVHRSALTLKLMTYAPTGAIVAAPTTSLPERLGGGRNWDYRYAWVRDAAFCTFSLLRLGFTEEADAFMGFLAQRVIDSGPDPEGPLQIMYRVDGSESLSERQLDHFEGYEGSAPVRVGNDAVGQLQLDIYGALVDSIYLYNKWGQPISSGVWEGVTTFVEWVCENWDQPDEGVWEVRGGRRNFLYSRLMCWVAIERAIRVAHQRGLPADLVRWDKARDAIYYQIMDRFWDPELKAFVQHRDGHVLDASVLMMPLTKFIAPTDPRWLSTLDLLADTLVSDSLVYRYDPHLAPDGLEGEEGTMSICTFWYAEALARAGRVDEARLVFEKMVTYANHLGLYAEQLGPTGEHLGNFPQAFTHLALISAAFQIDRALG
ncbi:pentatricopeptide repeat domain-containing protein (PPR motif) [Asanoa hainanensis]|uniref:Pentatricopeptide repeat domain-containing protein (PPR motif) n=1 Tax=Asanoa hainanensis TaxID=560556 RepID=A0A239PFM1_9ACTN|nr:glycoside hydrolase family 15 protein [Asanoa hainanensis]SNT65822.1 pentatricopeptide repeat domain-containing protein (PPR motif) [Asanoa hainanensis]